MSMSKEKERNFYFLVVDLEATCSDDSSIARHKMEIIEIGAVMLNRTTWEIDAEYQQFIKPVRHPLLTDFCTQLTTIKQEDIENAPTFPEVITQFKQWISSIPRWCVPWSSIPNLSSAPAIPKVFETPKYSENCFLILICSEAKG